MPNYPIMRTGDPELQRASFTRFLLPFKWRAQDASDSRPGAPSFREATDKDWIHSAKHGTVKPIDQQRLRYLTSQTSELLFRNARWFVLKGDLSKPWRELELPSGFSKQPFKANLRHPSIVLFECNPAALDNYELLHHGFLIHEAWFDGELTLPDFLQFNEVFRYWRCPYDKHLANNQALLSSIIQQTGGDFYDGQWGQLLSSTLQIDTKPYSLKPNSKDGATKDVPNWWVINPDDRAFTLPFAVINDSTAVGLPKAEARALSQPRTSELLTVPYRPSALEQNLAGYWVKLMNVDTASKDFDGAATGFEIEWADKRTYTRWAHYSVLYGFCEHAFAAIVPEALNEDGNPDRGEPPLADHFRAMYFDTTLLLLYMRVCVLRFSGAIHDATRKITSGDFHIEQLGEEYREIRRQFLLLENLYQYPILSNQQQHLEMFEKQRQFMDVTELYEEIDKEVTSSDEFFNNELDNRRNELAGTLNLVAAIGVAAGAAFAALATERAKLWSSRTSAEVILFIFCAMFFLVLSPFSQWIGTFVDRRKTWKWVFVLFLTAALLIHLRAPFGLADLFVR